MEKDLVCGMTVDPRTAEKAEYQGRTFYFCSKGCKAQFERTPQKYIEPKRDHDVEQKH